MTLGEKIQALRKQRNISQEQLADQMNVTRQAVSKWEVGESLPDVDNIVRLSEILDVSIDYLLKTSHDNTSQGNAAFEETTFDETAFEDATFEGSSLYINEDMDVVYERDSSRRGVFSGNYEFDFGGSSVYPLAILVYLIMGIVWGQWRHIWLVFVIAWVIEEIMDYFKHGKLHISFYSLGFAVFLIMGIFFGMWRYAWIAFVAAWALDSMFVPVKRKKKKKNRNDNIHINIQ